MPTAPLPCIVLAAGLTIFAGCATPPASDDPCEDCRIEFESLGVFGDDSDPASPDLLVYAADHDRAGNWYVTAGGAGTEILVYGPDGRFTRTIGRSGEGPGEFTGLQYILVVNDTLHAFSNGPRHTVLTTDGRVIRVERIPVPARRAFLAPGGELLLWGKSLTSPIPGFRIWVRAADSALTSFGSGDTLPPYRSPAVDTRIAAMQSRDSVWLARPVEYRLELWTPDDRVARVIERRPDWFPWPQERLQVLLRAMWVDTGGRRLWVAASSLRSATTENPISNTIVEVIDLDTGNAVARDSMPDVRAGRFGASPHFTTDGMLYRLEEQESGNVAVHAWRPRLVLPSSGSEARSGP